MRSLFLAHEYTSFFFWAEKITILYWDRKLGDNDQPRHMIDMERKGYMIVRVVSVLNVFLVLNDIIQAGMNQSSSFMFSSFLRLALLPLLSFFHIAVGFMFDEACKDKILKWTTKICMIFSGIVFVVSLILLIYFSGFNTILQLENLRPRTTDHQDEFRDPRNPICRLDFESFSVWDLIGFALGPYEVKREPELFEIQMTHFFNQSWRHRFNISTLEFNGMPVVTYHENKTNLTAIGLRGSASGSELSFQAALFVWAYILPSMTEIAPFFETLTEWRVPSLAASARHAGNNFFDTKSIPRRFVEPILDWFDEANFAPDQVVLTGIGTGGVIAKTIAMLRHVRGFGFFGMPVFETSYMSNFDFDDSDAIYVTTVYNQGGLLTAAEPDIANNFGVPWIEAGGIARDTRYRSACTMYQMCFVEGFLEDYC
jgi:hypothetical protein